MWEFMVLRILLLTWKLTIFTLFLRDISTRKLPLAT